MTIKSSKFVLNLDDEEVKPNLRKVASENPTKLDLNEQFYINQYINQYLRDYQRDGIKFLFKNYQANNGCILADDMGLGKTIQVIGFISAILQKTGFKEDLDHRKPECIRKQLKSNKVSQRPFLVVCPGSVLYNWLNEFNTWGYFSIGKYHGGEYKQTLDKIENNRYDVVLTTHETCRDHIQKLADIEWNAVIVDECHKIKEFDTKLTVAFKQFKTKRRFGLSGTILQNNLMEFWCLMDWANPDCLGTREQFTKKYATPIEEGQKADATSVELFEKIKLSGELKNIKDNYVIRRTKDLIADQLPKKSEKVVYCQLTDFQIDIYKRILKHYEKNTSYEPKQKNFAYINLLLKLANHPALLLRKYSQDAQSPLTQSVIAYIQKLFQDDDFDNLDLKFESPFNCGKMTVLMRLLKFLNEKNEVENKIEKAKVLLFSYSVKLLDLLQNFITSEGYNFLRIDGSVNNQKRIELVDKFNNDRNIFIFLISTKAGGVGLNITGANYVIIFDPNWNPSHDLQAADRAYRIGQQRDVYVYRLISTGCIEENIYLRQVDKQLLNKECIENEDSRRYFTGSKKSKGDSEIYGISNIMRLATDNSCLTKEIFRRNLKIEREIAGLNVSSYVKINKDLKDDIFDDEESKESYDDDNDEGENGKRKNNKEDENIKSKAKTIDEILQNENIVHIHDNKNVTSSSKIEKRLRECIANKVPTDELASKIKPQLSTLDYIELEELNDLVDESQLGNFKGKDVHVIYGSVPENIRRQQFIQMANILNTTPHELALKVNKMEKEERYKQLKAFYLKTYPQSKEFYEHFSNKSKLKRENSRSLESVSKKIALSPDLEDKEDDQNGKLSNKFDLENEFSIENMFNEKEKEIEKFLETKKVNKEIDFLDELINENRKEIITEIKEVDKASDTNDNNNDNSTSVINSLVNYDRLMDDLFD